MILLLSFRRSATEWGGVVCFRSGAPVTGDIGHYSDLGLFRKDYWTGWQPVLHVSCFEYSIEDVLHFHSDGLLRNGEAKFVSGAEHL